MTAESYVSGHEVEFINNQWVYSDNKEVVSDEYRNCAFCLKSNTPEGHDGCLGTLHGVVNACCGHGRVDQAYLQFEDKRCIRGQEALDKIKIIKEGS